MFVLSEVGAFEFWRMMGYLIEAWLQRSLLSHSGWTVLLGNFFILRKKILLKQQQCRVVLMIEQ